MIAIVIGCKLPYEVLLVENEATKEKYLVIYPGVDQEICLRVTFEQALSIHSQLEDLLHEWDDPSNNKDNVPSDDRTRLRIETDH